MPDFCSRLSAPPPAPTNTNLANAFTGVCPMSRRILISQVPSLRRFSPVTRRSRFSPTPCSTRWSMSVVVSEPKSTSVPPGIRVAAIGCDFSRPGIISGAQERMTRASSLYSMPSNSGWSFSASHRLRRYATFSSPVTKLMCGVGLMNVRGSGIAPDRTRCAQNCRVTWNCSFTFTAPEMSIVPSGSSGV